jgi:hypothetical protein
VIGRGRGRGVIRHPGCPSLKVERGFEVINSLRAEAKYGERRFVSKLTSKNGVASTPNICVFITI